jgi:hypothetical protein
LVVRPIAFSGDDAAATHFDISVTGAEHFLRHAAISPTPEFRECVSEDGGVDFVHGIR